MIEKWILPYLSHGKRGFKTTVPMIEIVECILYRLKTCCQWREVPTKQFFTAKVLKWGTVFYYFNKWSKAGYWKEIWANLLKTNLYHLDLSSAEFDGSARRPVIHSQKTGVMQWVIKAESPPTRRMLCFFLIIKG